MAGTSAPRTLLALALLAVMPLAGCNNNRLEQERAAYDQQNRELHEQLLAARTASDQLLAENERLRSENASLRSQASAPPPVAFAPSANAFEGIDDIEVIQGAGIVTVRVPGDVLFASGKVALKDAAKQTLDQVAGVLNADYAGQTIRVEGYTDADPIRKSKWADNLELSLQRAAAVHRYLQAQGVSSDRMYAAGFGEEKPQGSKAQSRRVEIVVEQN